METFGRYQLQEKLGQGGMGVVYRAFDTVLERTIALKLVLSTEGIEPELRERLFREARAAGNLKHKNIVTIYDLGEQDGRPYLAMEYLEGEDLQRRLRRPEKMSLGHKLDLAIEICDGLAHAHAHGVIHRDIKPANIFITAPGSAKLLDFGLARLMTSQLTRSNMLMGTINYMAPEQVRGERADHRSDIFSTGVLMYELLGGRKAFEGDSAASTLMKILQDVPEPLCRLDPAVPRDLAGIVDRTLAKLPDERYQSMEQVRRDLEGFRDRYRATGPIVPAPQSSELDATVLSTTPAPSAIDRAPLAASRTSTPAVSTARSADASSGPSAPPRRRGVSVAVAAGAIILIAVPGAWWLTHRSGRPAPSSSAAVAPAQATAAPPQTSPVQPKASTAPPPESTTQRAVTEQLRLAQQSLEAHDYMAAQTSAEAVLIVDPGNADATRIRTAAREGAAAAARSARATEEAQAATHREDSRARSGKAGAPRVTGVPAAQADAGPATQPAGEKPPAVTPSAPSPPVSTQPPAGAASSVASSPPPAVSSPPVSTPRTATGSSAASSSPQSSRGPAPDASGTAASQEQIAALLDQYKQALEAKNLDQLRQIWPSLDSNTEKGIQDQFGIAKRIRVEIVNPQISVAGTSAHVSFTRRYVVDTVNGDHLETTSNTLMDAHRTANGWVIGSIRFP